MKHLTLLILALALIVAAAAGLKPSGKASTVTYAQIRTDTAITYPVVPVIGGCYFVEQTQ